MLTKLLKRNVYVKPVDRGMFNNCWIVAEMNALQSFVDDLRRTRDLRIALYNLREVLR
jgi:hypothetical protein